jgi:cytochrome c553
MVRRAVAGLITCAAIGALIAKSFAADASEASPNGAAREPTPAYFPADAARGKTLAVQCFACHGVLDMKLGNPPFHVPMLSGQRPEAIFAALRDYKSGVRASDLMAPIVANLSLQDMRDLGAYLSSSGPVLPGTHDEGSWAHQKVRDDCTACHGESGMGVMPGVPVLTGQHEDYLVHAMNAYRSGSRQDPTMGPIAKKLSEKEVALLAAYFAKQKHLELSK